MTLTVEVQGENPPTAGQRTPSGGQRYRVGRMTLVDA
jgi:hypothetical protein